MRTLTASELLFFWERSLAQNSVQRALTLLSIACPEFSVEQLTQLSIGQRDSLLLQLRALTFGPRLASIVQCPKCKSYLDVSLNVNDILVTGQLEFEPAGIHTITSGEMEASFRLPNSMDLLVIANEKDVQVRRAKLLKACIVGANRKGDVIDIEHLPDQVVAAIIEQMDQCDPQANVQIALNCPTCSNFWQVLLDVMSFFWTEINAWARRIIRDIHTLAVAYGWREADILAMSAVRRQLYLEMVGL